MGTTYTIILVMVLTGCGGIDLPSPKQLCNFHCFNQCDNSGCMEFCPNVCANIPKKSVPVIPVTPTIPSSPVVPETICGMGSDGGYGFLNKPVSESTGNLVLLAPSKYKDMSVRVEGHPYIKVVRETCCLNGNRPHWFFDRKGSSFPKPTKYVFSNGDCWIVNDPSRRVD